jgi:hypothetical protein
VHGPRRGERERAGGVDGRMKSSGSEESKVIAQKRRIVEILMESGHFAAYSGQRGGGAAPALAAAHKTH